jgi:thiamine biosynthesis protein ThiS
MDVLLNGERRQVPAETTVASLLQTVGVDPRTVAVELNRVVVKRVRYAETVIPPGAEVEIVAFVGGG